MQVSSFSSFFFLFVMSNDIYVLVGAVFSAIFACAGGKKYRTHVKMNNFIRFE